MLALFQTSRPQVSGNRPSWISASTLCLETGIGLEVRQGNNTGKAIGRPRNWELVAFIQICARRRTCCIYTYTATLFHGNSTPGPGSVLRNSLHTCFFCPMMTVSSWLATATLIRVDRRFRVDRPKEQKACK